ncbi:protein-arginine omega-N asymmetric methyltransferase [Aureococcus anophagefferens]|uniref:Protein-arginine omega-N asymmetric methyltransferase n=1 Tax=Aureococcus anophagefferens TaxID=44056 RepID=A0ABR1FXS7_AURAN
MAALEVSSEASTVAAKHDLLPTVLQRVATAMCLPDDDVAALSPALRRKVGQMLSAREFERYRRAALELDGVAAGVAARDAKLLPGGFAAGDRVEVFGLAAAADRNGSRGVAERREKDRVAVVLDDGARLAVKPENLRLAPSKPRDDDVAASLEPSSEVPVEPSASASSSDAAASSSDAAASSPRIAAALELIEAERDGARAVELLATALDLAPAARRAAVRQEAAARGEALRRGDGGARRRRRRRGLGAPEARLAALRGAPAAERGRFGGPRETRRWAAAAGGGRGLRALAREAAAADAPPAAAPVEAWHWPMVDDAARFAFFDAFLRREAPGKRVLDLGAGCGALSLAAVGRGASFVVACERSPALADALRATLARGGVGADRCDARDRDSRRLGAEDPVDVVVAEILDAALLGEGVLPALADAYRKHPGAAFCPRLATLRVTPASSPALARRFVADGVRAFQPYDVFEGLAYEPLAPPVDMDLDLIELARRAAPADGTRRRVTIPGGFGETTVTRRGRLDALVVSFVLRDGDRSLDSAAGHWREACFFVEERPELDVGAALRISASTAPLDHGEGDALRFDVAAPSASIAVPPKAPRNALDATTDDVARFNDGAYRAAHARAVAAATPERGRVLELGFCDARSNDGPALPAFGPATLRCPGGRAASIVAAASGDRFDVLAHSLVEPSGLLRRDALQEVEALKRFALKAGTVGAPRVLPSAATVFGVLVDAPALAATKFTREGRLGDHDVSALDDRADATLRDLAPAACARLPALCAPFPLLDLNLDVRSASVAEEAARAAVASSPPVSTPGAAHALLFWWHLRYGGEHGAVAETVSTAPALDGGETGDGHWRVAGVVLDRGRGLPLARGDVLDVHLAVRGSKVGVLKTVTRRAKDGGAAAARPS